MDGSALNLTILNSKITEISVTDVSSQLMCLVLKMTDGTGTWQRNRDQPGNCWELRKRSREGNSPTYSSCTVKIQCLSCFHTHRERALGRAEYRTESCLSNHPRWRRLPDFIIMSPWAIRVIWWVHYWLWNRSFSCWHLFQYEVIRINKHLSRRPQ